MIRHWGSVDSFDVPIIRSWGFVDLFDVPIIQYLGFVVLLKVCANARDDWTACRIRMKDPIFRVFCPIIFTFWLDRLEDPLFRVPSRSLSEVVHAIHSPIFPDRFLIRQCSCNSLSNPCLGMFLVDIVDKYITRWSNITVLYARSVVAISRYKWYQVYFGYNYDILD